MVSRLYLFKFQGISCLDSAPDRWTRLPIAHVVLTVVAFVLVSGHQLVGFGSRLLMWLLGWFCFWQFRGINWLDSAPDCSMVVWPDLCEIFKAFLGWIRLTIAHVVLWVDFCAFWCISWLRSAPDC